MENVILSKDVVNIESLLHPEFVKQAKELGRGYQTFKFDPNDDDFNGWFFYKDGKFGIVLSTPMGMY